MRLQQDLAHSSLIPKFLMKCVEEVIFSFMVVTVALKEITPNPLLLDAQLDAL